MISNTITIGGEKHGTPELVMANNKDNLDALQTVGNATEKVNNGIHYAFPITNEKFRIAVLMVLAANPRTADFKVCYMKSGKFDGHYLAIFPANMSFPTAEQVLDIDIEGFSEYYH